MLQSYHRDAMAMSCEPRTGLSPSITSLGARTWETPTTLSGVALLDGSTVYTQHIERIDGSTHSPAGSAESLKR